MIVTHKAIAEVKRIAVEQELDLNKICLRARVIGGGCSGFQTKLDLDECWDIRDNVEVVDGVTVVVDKRSALYLEEANVDFHESDSKRGFVVHNSMAQTTCGCKSALME